MTSPTSRACGRRSAQSGCTLPRAGLVYLDGAGHNTYQDRPTEVLADVTAFLTDAKLRGCGLTPAKRSDPDPTMLTPQEQAVARLVAVGMSNRQVAGELFISVKTVQFHLTHIYTKLGVSSRAELAAQYRN